MHLSLGLGGISTNATADSLAGLEVLEYVANQSAAYGVSPLVTVADPTLLPLAHDTLHRPPRLDRDHGMGLDTRLRWLAPESSAYAAGVMDILGTENVQKQRDGRRLRRRIPFNGGGCQAPLRVVTSGPPAIRTCCLSCMPRLTRCW